MHEEDSGCQLPELTRVKTQPSVFNEALRQIISEVYQSAPTALHYAVLVCTCVHPKFPLEECD